MAAGFKTLGGRRLGNGAVDFAGSGRTYDRWLCSVLARLLLVHALASSTKTAQPMILDTAFHSVYGRLSVLAGLDSASSSGFWAASATWL